MMYHVLPKSVRLARYFAPVAMLAFVPLATPFADDYFPPPDAKGGWRTLTDPGRVGERATLAVRPTLPSSNRTSRFPDIRLS